MSPGLTLREDHLNLLRSLVLSTPGQEGAALLLLSPCSVDADPWSGAPRRRYLSREVIPINPDDVISASGSHVTTSTRPLARALRQASVSGLVVGYVHSHPGGPPLFSRQDDQGEAEMARLAHNRNGAGTELVSLLITAGGPLGARVWAHPEGYQAMEHVMVTGDRLTIHRAWNGVGTLGAPEAFHRQGLAFGDALYRDVSSLRIGIVGCGATGSATAMLLARLGAQRLVLFDPDRVEHTNLSRLQGATHKDADDQRLKVDVVGDMVEGFGLGSRVVRITEWVGHRSVRDALKSCDIIFGCTDDHDGRTLLNRLAFIYAVPVIDMGIRIDPREPGQPVREAAGRVTVLQPGTCCLMCRKVIDGRRAASEHLERTNPGEYERQAREGYVVGSAGPNPAVVHLTTDVATMAVDELVHRLSGYRAAGSCDHRVRQFHMMADRQPGAARTGECRICEDPGDWSRGDSLQPFLGRIG